MMPQSRYYSNQRQSGVALFTVLILLLVLTAASAVLIQSQRWAVRQTADRLAVLDRSAASVLAHDGCVAKLRAGLEGSNTATLTGLDGQNAWRSVTDTNWDASGCIFEWYGLPPAGENTAWIPRVRVTSRAQSGNDVDLEVSEWRYPKCVTGQTCHKGGSVSVANRATVAVEYGAGEIVTARRPM